MPHLVCFVHVSEPGVLSCLVAHHFLQFLLNFQEFFSLHTELRVPQLLSAVGCQRCISLGLELCRELSLPSWNKVPPPHLDKNSCVSAWMSSLTQTTARDCHPSAISSFLKCDHSLPDEDWNGTGVTATEAMSCLISFMVVAFIAVDSTLVLSPQLNTVSASRSESGMAVS